LTRRSVQSYLEINFFLVDESGSPSAVSNTFLSFAIRDKKAARTSCAMKRAASPAILVAVVLLAVAVIAEAQQPGKVSRIGYVSGSSGFGPREEALQQGLRDLGYVEGQNITIEWRFADGQQDRLPKLVDELVHLKVDTIVTEGARVTRAAKNTTKTIPIIMGSDGDPIGDGHVASLARPGGNITGLATLITGLSGKRLEVLKEAIPGISRVGVIWNPESPPSAAGFKEAQIAAQALGLQLQSFEVRAPTDFEGAFQAATKGRVRALTVLSDSLMFSNRTRILALVAKHKLPTMHTQSLWAEDGGLMSYGTNLPDLFRRAATYVDKILKGAKPADLPVEQPTKFDFVINLKTANQIGLTIPPNVLARADRVIK
jgi:putative tryptophan/tyrosine transport system substrate-binding protein